MIASTAESVDHSAVLVGFSPPSTVFDRVLQRIGGLGPRKRLDSNLAIGARTAAAIWLATPASTVAPRMVAPSPRVNWGVEQPLDLATSASVQELMATQPAPLNLLAKREAWVGTIRDIARTIVGGATDVTASVEEDPETGHDELVVRVSYDPAVGTNDLERMHTKFLAAYVRDVPRAVRTSVVLLAEAGTKKT